MPRHSREFSATKSARSLRRSATPPERVLWSHLRAGRLHGLKFRRQYPVGPYVCDFYCTAATLAVEIDGRVHETKAAEDRTRDAYLASQGIRTLRVSASWISTDIDAVLGLIAGEARKRL